MMYEAYQSGCNDRSEYHKQEETCEYYEARININHFMSSLLCIIDSQYEDNGTD